MLINRSNTEALFFSAKVCRVLTVVLFGSAALAQPTGASNGTEGTQPLTPFEAVKSIQTRPGLVVELVAAEPLIQDPVAIDWDPSGKLWVCEMNDYPSGMDQNWQPGGRVKLLEDTNSDGVYDRATVFIENLPFPTGITAWNRGLLICAAPDILYARDTDGDGKADKIEKLFTGFATDNFQARVNSLSLGLDNWIYGANGLLGGTIRSLPNSLFTSEAELDIRNRDFRFSPKTGALELAGGLSQQGRVRDDWGNWFGCDNTRLLLHFPMPEHYLRRNPHVAARDAARSILSGPDANRLYPTSRTLERFNDHGHVNRVTSASGVAIYRDTLLGDEFYGNAFTCESVHNLVHREVISGDLALSSRRAPGEAASEFLSSTDNWFRPVQVRTGPDGGLYIVDMYRFLIEHPRWIPAARLAAIEIRAGADKGRIYRVRPEGKSLRPVPDLTKLDDPALATLLDSPNGTERDRIHAELLHRDARSTLPRLRELARSAVLPRVRVQALAVVAGLKGIDPKLIQDALEDSDPAVRRQALVFSEPFLQTAASRDLSQAVLRLKDDRSLSVAHQLALTLGFHPSAGEVLVDLAKRWLANAEMRTAILSSALPHCGELFQELLQLDQSLPELNQWIPPLAATLAASGNAAMIAAGFNSILPKQGEDPTARQLAVAVQLWQALQELPESESFTRPEQKARFKSLLGFSRRVAPDSSAPLNIRQAAIATLGNGEASEADLRLLAELASSASRELRQPVIIALRRQRSPEVAPLVIRQWQRFSPTARGEMIALLLNRSAWTRSLLENVRGSAVPAHELSPADRQRLIASTDLAIRDLAKSLFAEAAVNSRSELLERYKPALTLAGDIARGSTVFEQQCASCHALNGKGYPVGPDLAPLRGRDREYWIKNILDPNAVIEPRFVSYHLETRDDRLLSGIIQNETGNSLTVVSGNGISETALRSEIRDIRASTVSLMPEGLEAEIDPGQMADLLAYLASDSTPRQGRPGDVLRDTASVARLILDAAQPAQIRETAVQANPQFAAALIEEMTRDLAPGTPEEYARIPWIWRVAIACGKRNDAGQLRAMLRNSLPTPEQPLHDWQAVVIGGGIINGLGQRGIWPAERVLEIIGSDAGLEKRWHRALDLAAIMTDNEKVPHGTRYDALRMIAMTPWDKCGEQLLRYTGREVHPELQMGAVSGIADVHSPRAAEALVSVLPNLTEANAKLVFAGLLRDDDRTTLLLDAVASGRIDPAQLRDHREALLSHTNPEIRARAQALL